MKKIGFDNDKYLEMQSQHIKERINFFGGKLYLEFGGKLFDDFHASRVLPGFQPDSKIKMLTKLKDNAELIIVINASHIEKNKVRSDLGITYDQDVLRLIDAFRAIDLFVGNIVITHYTPSATVDKFKDKLCKMGLKVSLHYLIDGYPSNVNHIVSDEGYGLNDYVETEKELVVITAPGPGSGKMAVCLSQLYHEHKRGVKAGYAKFETFPIWNLPLKHAVNLAYEAATADLNDVNMIDPFHLEAYGTQAINYNRDVEIFPVLNALFQKIKGESPYKSPTDMGVNMAGYCIFDDEACTIASNDEIIRRYYAALVDLRKDMGTEAAVKKIELIMQQANISVNDRDVVAASLAKRDLTDGPACAIKLLDDTIITGKTSTLLGASSACLLNALKKLGNIDDAKHLISPEVIEPVQKLKVGFLGNHNPRLHTDETLIALSIAAVNDQDAACALAQLPKLANCEAHSSVLLSEVDINVFKKLKINLTQEPVYLTKKLYHKK